MTKISFNIPKPVLADWVAAEWCYVGSDEPEDVAVNELLARLCDRFSLPIPLENGDD